MRRAAIYRRVSTPGQVDGFSLDGQLETLTGLAESLGYGWEDFCDPGVSGEKLEERPELMRLLGQLDRFDALLVTDESRLARSEKVAFVIRDALREADVRLVTLEGETDLSDPGESTMSAMRALFAVMEQHTRTKRMSEGLERAAERGLWTGGTAPLGYRLAKTPTDHTTLELDPDGVEFLELVIGLVVDEAMTAYQAAKRINALGHRTRTGRPWSHRSLRMHLGRRHLVGEIPYESTEGPILRRFPPIISQERFTELQDALGRTTRTAPRKIHMYPFSGRIVCQCGGHMVGSYRNDRDARYYICSSNTNSALTGERCPIQPRQIRAEELETLLWEPIRAALDDPKRLLEAATLHTEHPGHDPDQLGDTITDRKGRLARVKAERLRIFRDAKTLGLTNPEIKTLLDQLAAEHSELTAELRRLERQAQLLEAQIDPLEQAHKLASVAAARLDDGDLETQSQLVALLDIQVKRSNDSYEITGAIPIESGKIETGALQHP